MSHCKTMGRQFGNTNGSGQENTTLYMPVSLSECTYIHMYIHTDVFVCVIGSDGEKERRHVRTYEDFVAYTYVCTIILLLLYIHMY